ncbi:MAG: hypothetical protein JST36_03380 [Bacteroidetes bacterium]|nr:hypothetical protein [Bacteroidota bacterium]
MAIELVQKKAWQTERRFVLYSDRLVVEAITWRRVVQYDVRLDQLGFDLRYEAENTAIWKLALRCLVFTATFAVVGLLEALDGAFLPWLLVTIFSFSAATWVFFRPYQDDLILSGGAVPLRLFRATPSERIVLEFVEQIKSQYKENLKERYTVFDEATAESDYYARLGWLLENGVITEEEHDEFKVSFDIQKLL